jgi:prepilin peptidase CpaA
MAGIYPFIDFTSSLCENPRKRPLLRGTGEGGGCRLSLSAAISESSQNGSFSISSFPTSSPDHGTDAPLPAQPEARLKPVILAGAVVLAVIAGWTDLRSRRIPNWLTVPGLLIGVAANTVLGGWTGLKTSLLGAAVGLALLLPFVLLRSLGAGDWKLAGALGAFAGPGLLVDLLLASVFVAGLMAVALVIYKRRVRQTLRNMGHILISLVTFRLPGSSVSLDNPDSLKVPYGVALALTVVLYGIVWKLRIVA